MNENPNTHTLSFTIYVFAFLFFFFFLYFFHLHFKVQIQNKLNKNYITLWKLQKQPLKNPGIAGTSSVKPKDSRNSGGVSSPRATATGGAWVHAPPPENPNKQGGCNNLLPSSFPCRRWTTSLPAKHQETQTARFPVLSHCFRSTLFCLPLLIFCSSLLQVAVGSEVRASASPLLRLADRAMLPCPSCSRMLGGERRVSRRRCCDGKETSLLDLFQVAGVSVSSGMEIGGEAVVGEELLLLWRSLEAGVDVFPRCCCSWVSLLELGRPREERTVVGRESQKKKEGAGSRGGRSDGPIWVREGCCSAAAVVEGNGCDGEWAAAAGREERLSGGGKVRWGLEKGAAERGRWPVGDGWRPRENGRKRMMSGGLGEPKPWGGAPLLEIGLALGLGFFVFFWCFKIAPPL